MAILENVGLAEQVFALLLSVRRDMRRNATAYKDDAASGRLTVAQVETVMGQDADAYLALLAKLKAAYDNTTYRAMIDDGLKRYVKATGTEDPLADEVLPFYTNLKAAADHQKAAAKSTVQQINTEADWILANVSPQLLLW